MIAWVATKFCLNVKTLPKPQAAAMRATGQVVVSRRRRASSRSRARTQRAGVVPVTPAKRRVKLRLLIRGVRREVLDREQVVEVAQRPVDGLAQVSHAAGLGHGSIAEAVPAEVRTSPWST